MRLLCALAIVVSTACATQPARVRLDTAEAEAVLHILQKRTSGDDITAADWERLFATDGYVRLKEREHAMQRPFDEETFRAFVMSDTLLARQNELRRTLAEWSRTDLNRAARLAGAYLPRGTVIAATAYPAIKPATNSFVHDLGRNPALFVYLEPLPRDIFEGIVAHEFHHIGYAAACSSPDLADARLSHLHQWLSAFGEGLATLAAAGGPGGRPRLRADALAAWDRRMPHLEEDFAAAARFLTSVLRGELDAAAQRQEGMKLFGIVGPWYTVGWHMAVVIEEELGRQTLIEAVCDQRTLLGTYNAAAGRRIARTGQPLPLWPNELANAFGSVDDAHR